MADWFTIDWQNLFQPAGSLLEIFLRGTVTYLSILVILRLIPVRSSGGVSNADLLFMILVGNALQNALIDDRPTVTEGLVLTVTLLFWNFVIDWLGFHFPFIQRLVNSSPMLLVKDGKVQSKNMRRELITEDELMTFLRTEGVESLENVRALYLEGDGRVSVQTYSAQPLRKSNSSRGIGA